MKNSTFHRIGFLACALSIGATASAVPSATSPYVTDPQNEYVQDATSEAIGSVNMVLCIMDAMNMSGSGMLNAGPYVALIDMNKCQSHGNSNSSTSGSSGASVAANYMTAVVDATRASSTDPMIAKVWMSLTENGSAKDIYVRLSATQSPTDVPPYGVFRLDYIGKNTGPSPVTQFNGFIDSTASLLQFMETGPNSSNVALSMSAGSTNSGSGTMNTGIGTGMAATYNFNYNANYFRRNDGTNDQCFDRLKANASRSVWRYGTYNANDGSRVDQANPGFPITATYGGNSYYGFANYYGINFQGLDLNAINNVSNPIAGVTVTDQRPGNTTTYNLSKVGGKLTKWSKVDTTLSALDGIPFFFSGDMTGKSTGNAAVTGWGNWQMQWNNTAANFTVVGTQACGPGGCTVTAVTPVATVNATAFNTLSISGWSDSFGGNLNIPFTNAPHAGNDTLSYFTQSVVIPGSAGAPANLYCLSNCPDAASVTAANAYASPAAVPSPFNNATTMQWFSATSAANTVSYTFGASGLMNGATPMIINQAAFFAASPQFQWGVNTGRLFDTLLTNANCPAGFPGTTVCEPGTPTVYYTWSTGTAQWNQTLWLTPTGSSTPVAFDPPQNIQYTVPAGAAYGTWAGKGIQLQFNGFGNLWGIPGNCVNPVDNANVDCSVAGSRYVPMFSLPNGATMTLNGTPLVVKALDAELRFAALSAATCSGMTLTPLTPPSGGTHDMSNAADAYYIGAKPTPANPAPKVIDGVVQY